MKKPLQLILIILMVLGAVSTSIAQKKGEVKIEIPEFAIDDQTKKITYNEVVALKGVPGEFYERALTWANKFYKSPTNVLRKKDKDNGELVAKSRFYIFYTDPKKGTKTRTKTIEYTLSFKFKENRYRYEITDISYKATSYQGVEQWLDQNKKQYSYRTSSNLVQIDEEMKKIISSFKPTIGSTAKGKEDW